MRRFFWISCIFLLLFSTAGSALAQKRGVKPRSASPAGRAAPTGKEILEVHAWTFATLYGGKINQVAGSVAYPSPYGGIAYYEHRSISNLACSRLSATSFRCSYDLSKSFSAAPDSTWGKLQVAFMRPTSGRFTYGFSWVRVNGVTGWISNELHNEIVADVSNQARRNQSAADIKRKYEEDERKRRYDDCRYVQRNAFCTY